MRPNAILVLFGVMALAHGLSVQSDLFYEFSARHMVLVCATLAAFLFGYLGGRGSVLRVCTIRVARTLAVRYIGALKARRYFIALFLLFSALTLLDRALLFGSSFWSPDVVMQYRWLIVTEGGSNAIKGLSLGNFFIYLMPTFLMAYRVCLSAAAKVSLTVIFLVNVYLSSGRSSLFLPVLVLFYYWAIPLRINFWLAIKAGLAVYVLFLGFDLIGSIVGKGTDELSFLVYLAAPLHAFDVVLNDPTALQGYWLSFFPLQSTLGTLFGISPAVDLPNVLTPLPVNVYSIFGVYYNDYGIVGLFVWFFLFGGLAAFLEKGYRITCTNSFRVYAALNMSILTLSIFYDYYTTSGVIWMTVLLTPFFFDQPLTNEPLINATKEGAGR